MTQRSERTNARRRVVADRAVASGRRTPFRRSASGRTARPSVRTILAGLALVGVLAGPAAQELAAAPAVPAQTQPSTGTGGAGQAPSTTTKDLLTGTTRPEATTTTVGGGGAASSASDEIDDDNRKVWMVVAGLVLVALLLAVLTWKYWQHTKPVRRPGEGDGKGGRRAERTPPPDDPRTTVTEDGPPRQEARASPATPNPRRPVGSVRPRADQGVVQRRRPVDERSGPSPNQRSEVPRAGASPEPSSGRSQATRGASAPARPPGWADPSERGPAAPRPPHDLS